MRADVDRSGAGTEMFERVMSGGKEIALILRAGFHSEGIRFFTPSDYSQQLAYMKRPKGYVISPHVHNEVHRDVSLTLEVLVVRSGTAKLDLYDEHHLIGTRFLGTGDIVLLASGGHGIEMIEDTEIIEIKQGPYAGDQDKTRFTPLPDG